MQHFDYIKEEGEKEFCCASCSPSGQSVVLGSFDRLRLFNWSPKKEGWDEGGLKHIPYLYTITAVSWKKDGAKIVAVCHVTSCPRSGWGFYQTVTSRGLLLKDSNTFRQPAHFSLVVE